PLRPGFRAGGRHRPRALAQRGARPRHGTGRARHRPGYRGPEQGESIGADPLDRDAAQVVLSPDEAQRRSRGRRHDRESGEGHDRVGRDDAGPGGHRDDCLVREVGRFRHALRVFMQLSVILRVLCVSGFVFCAHAQDYPAKPVKVIVPYPPGGGTDVVAGLVLPKLGERLNTSFLIENRSGSGGTTGTEIVAKATADGYTLAMVNGSHAINPSLHRKLAYDAVYDFSPVSLLVSGPALLVVHPSVKANTVRELVALAKARPG